MAPTTAPAWQRYYFSLWWGFERHPYNGDSFWSPRPRVTREHPLTLMRKAGKDVRIGSWKEITKEEYELFLNHEA